MMPSSRADASRERERARERDHQWAWAINSQLKGPGFNPPDVQPIGILTPYLLLNDKHLQLQSVQLLDIVQFLEEAAVASSKNWMNKNTIKKQVGE